MFEVPVKTAAGVHEIAPGVSLEWLHDGRIYVVTLTNVRRETIDAYVELNKSLIRQVGNTLALTLQDVSDSNMGLTSHVRQKTAEIWDELCQRQLVGYMAFVISPGPMASMAKLFVNTANRFVASKMSLQFFTDRQKALEFLETKLDR